MKIYRNIYLAIFMFLFSVIVFCCTIFNFELGKVSNDDEKVTITIEQGSISNIGKTLKENNLIKSELFFKVYVKLTGKTNLFAATYELSPNMGTKKIVEILSSPKGVNSNQISITFKEGVNMRKIAQVIEENTNNTKEDVLELIKDKEYLKELIDEYWFLDESILNSKIYYPLEGYLHPNTYYFESKDVSVKDVFKSMLKETDKILTRHKNDINNSKMSIDEIITLASMVELEARTLEDRQDIASVFLNRINSGISLGSDVTTYYAAKVDMEDRDYLYASELNDCNNYNTRCLTYSGLPVGPVCNPSIESIESSINPEKSDYYYFVADINGDVYFSKTLTEQNNIISKLKKEGLWYN